MTETTPNNLPLKKTHPIRIYSNHIIGREPRAHFLSS